MVGAAGSVEEKMGINLDFTCSTRSNIVGCALYRTVAKASFRAGSFHVESVKDSSLEPELRENIWYLDF